MGLFSNGGLRLSAASAATAAGLLGATAGALPSLSAGPTPSAGTQSGASAATPATEVLTTDVLPGLSGLSSTPTAPGTRVQVGVTLANPAAAAQNATYNAIYTPGNPLYHHFLSAAAVAARFGVPQEQFDAVRTWATRDGLTLAYAPNTRDYLLLSGTVAQAERTFDVTVRTFKRAGTTFYANTSGPTVPAGEGVAGVIGLNDLLKSHTTDHAKAAASPAKPRTAQGLCDPSNTTCIGLTTPQDMWSAYGMPTNLADQSQNFGQGQQMGVLGEGAVAQNISDLRAFEKEFGLPQVPVTIHPVNDDFQDTSGTGEWDIDTQSSSGMAPKAAGETWYFAKDLTDPSVLGDITAFQSDTNGPMQANASFGECEEDPSSPVTQNQPGTGPAGLAGTAGVMFTAAAEDALQKATIEGKTLFSSTGDTGSSCPVVFAAVIGAGNGVLNQGYPETNYPASSRYVTAVGGTVLYTTPSTVTAPASNATRAQEYSWTFTGGGNTLYIPEPAYQKGIALLDNQPCISDPTGTPYATSTPCRGVPDVAAQSGDVASNGFAVNMSGSPDSQGAGTSLASPLWMGMWTRIQAAAPKNAGGQFTNGFANPALYKVGLNPTADANDFFDIGSGPPVSPVTNNGVYASMPRSPLDPSGWDYTSGLGVPNVTSLGKDVTGSATFAPDNVVTVAAPADCGQPGLPSCTTGTASCSTGLWDKAPHTATDTFGNSDPQLSLLHGAMSVSADGTTLRVLLTVTNLSETVPTGAAAAEWYMLWTYNKTVYFGNAELSAVPGSTPTFNDGTVTVTGTSHTYNPVHSGLTGHFTLGPNGVVEIDVPLANVGSPPVGAKLTGPAGETRIEIGAPGVGGLLESVDSAGPTCDYTIGSGPGAAAAPAANTTPSNGGTTTPVPNTGWPFPLLWPGLLVLALGLATTAVSRRRRRSRGEATI